MTDYGLSADELIIGTAGGVLVAPKGTALPTEWDDELDPGFASLGYLTPAGPSLNGQPVINKINAWQSQTPIASRVTERPMTVECELMQWNGDTVPFAFGGGTIEPAGTGWVYEPPDSSEADEYSLVLDVLDGDFVYRFVFERGYPAAGTNPTFNREGAAGLSIGFEVLTPEDGGKPYRIFTNNPAWSGGS